MREVARMRIGIDLGGTKIAGVVLARGGAIAASERFAAPRGDYAAAGRGRRRLAGRLKDSAGGAASFGIGIPGTVCPTTGVIKNANSTWLNGKPFDRDVAAALGQPVRMANDANCFALEATDGAAAGADPVFGAILGTGVGGGIVVGGHALVGAQGIAGEWGHNPLPAPLDDERPGPLCYCGRRGCIETFLSGPAFEEEFERDAGRRLSATDIAAAAGANDALAAAALNRYAERLARALGHVINLIDPEVIVLGGGLSKIDALYRLVPERLPAYVFSPTVRTRIVPPVHGDSSGVRGAAWLWPE
ncbi:MAG: ROK family protein [Alphaproteobacteria bacterium]